MPKVFYINEIVNFAIEKEQESYDLYKKLSELSKDSKLKSLFNELMNQEKLHKLFYANMLEHIKEEQTNAVEDETYQSYMRELIHQSRKAPSLSSVDLTNQNKALDFGISREKDSILFYVGLKNFVKDESKTMIDEIIREETRHMVLLSSMKN